MFTQPLFVLLVLGLLSSGCSSKKPRTESGRATAPAKSATALPTALVEPLASGASVTLAEVVNGKVAVIDLWATWCTACRDVSKNVELLAEAHKGKPFVAVGLDVGEERSVVGAFFDGQPPKFPIYLDSQFKVADALGARELPTILVVDKNGKIRLVKKKVDSDVLSLVEQLLAEAPAAGSSATP